MPVRLDGLSPGCSSRTPNILFQLQGRSLCLIAPVSPTTPLAIILHLASINPGQAKLTGFHGSKTRSEAGETKISIISARLE